MSQRPTPETDKVESLMIYVLNDITVALEHARKMERERDDALSLAASCQRAAVLLIDELNDTITELARQRDELRAAAAPSFPPFPSV